MSTKIGTPSTRMWRVEFPLGSALSSYHVAEFSAEVTDGGTLIFRDSDGVVSQAVSPSGWTQVTQA